MAAFPSRLTFPLMGKRGFLSPTTYHTIHPSLQVNLSYNVLGEETGRINRMAETPLDECLHHVCHLSASTLR